MLFDIGLWNCKIFRLEYGKHFVVESGVGRQITYNEISIYCSQPSLKQEISENLMHEIILVALNISMLIPVFNRILQRLRKHNRIPTANLFIIMRRSLHRVLNIRT